MSSCTPLTLFSPLPHHRLLPPQRVTGDVDVSLFKGKASIVARSSPFSLYNPHIASMDKAGGWNPQVREGRSSDRERRREGGDDEEGGMGWLG